MFMVIFVFVRLYVLMSFRKCSYSARSCPVVLRSYYVFVTVSTVVGN